jgi:hypothetical protein
MSDAYKHLTDTERTASALELRRVLSELADLHAERDSIIHALDDAGFQRHDCSVLERVQDAIKLNDALCAANSRYIEQIGELEAERDALRAAVAAVGEENGDE